MLRLKSTQQFNRDLKKLSARHGDLQALRDVIDLILQDTEESKVIMRQCHDAHRLKGVGNKNTYDCHIVNNANFVLIWRRENDEAIMLRTGTHQDVLGK